MYRLDLRMIRLSTELVSGDLESIFSGGGISIDTPTTEKLIMDTNDWSGVGDYYA